MFLVSVHGRGLLDIAGLLHLAHPQRHHIIIPYYKSLTAILYSDCKQIARKVVVSDIPAENQEYSLHKAASSDNCCTLIILPC